MDQLRAFVRDHFFSRREKKLLAHLAATNQVAFCETVVEQIRQGPMPAVSKLAKRVYNALAASLDFVEKADRDHSKELVIEFCLRLAGECFQRSDLSEQAFMDELRQGVYEEATERGIDYGLVDADMNWKEFEALLKDLKQSPVRPTESSIEQMQKTAAVVTDDKVEVAVSVNQSPHLIWNDEADFEVLVDDLVDDYKIFLSRQDLENLFGPGALDLIAYVDASKVHMLVYLFRQLCPTRPDPELVGDRIVSSNPSRKLWEVLANRLRKPDGSRWSVGTLKNYQSAVAKGDTGDMKLIRDEVEMILFRIRSKMAYIQD